VLHSTVQYTTKRAVLDGSCPSVPINVSTLCPASLGSVLIGGWGNGHDRISWLVNLVKSLDRCDREVCFVVAFYTCVTLNSTQFVYVYFEATLLADDLCGVETTRGFWATFVCLP
jgi:hypothetical protein